MAGENPSFTAQQWLDQGRAAYNALRLEEALASYQQVLALQPSNYEAHLGLARTLSRIINSFAVLLLGGVVHDYTSGFIAARAPVLRTLRLRGDYGEYCIDLLARAVRVGFVVKEVPYICVPRTAGESKTGANLWDYLVKGRKYVATIWNLWEERRT